jgi:dynein heavy chain 2
VIVGKEGCGKSLLLEASIQELERAEKCKLVTLHCNRETKASLIIQKLYQTCQKATSANGKVLRPLNCSRQIFVLKEVNLPKPDKYNTIELITFLQSLIAHEGFYDHNL